MTTTETKKHIDLRSLAGNTFVEGVYSIFNPQVGSTRNGKPFLKCLLRDASGEVPARAWSFEESRLNEIASTGFVWIAGQSQVYNNQVQVILEQVRPAEVSEDEMAALLPTTTRNIDDMMTELRGIMATIEHPAMKGLVDAYLNDETLMKRFRLAPAAVSLHHAWIGGLLEHTLTLLQLADRMLPLYTDLNRDLILAGLFLHDLAKTSELEWEQGFGYTDDGNLVGHIVRGAIMLQVKAVTAVKESGERLSPDALRCLQHIILSHHGQLEFGAAKLPSTPEAIFVSLLDNLDARTQMAVSAVERDREPVIGFTEKVWALGTRLYRADPLAHDAGASCRE